jgi:uncharacterized protein (TIGR00255 family)
MTGFARAEGQCEGVAWAWEVKSVNGKALDLRFRLPPGFDAAEAGLKASAAAKLRRGSINANLSITQAQRPPILRVNAALLDQLAELCRTLDGTVPADRPRLDGLLAIRGVLEVVEDPADPALDQRVAEAAVAGFEAALAGLIRTREAEGARLAPVLTRHLDEIETLVGTASEAAATQPSAIRARFQRHLAELLDRAPPVAEDRLAQEVAMLIQRADVREELDRLQAHIGAAREMMAEGSGVGRRLDFLCQEFNREANTLCSKAAELDLTRTGIALKSAIEQFREQIQNIE